MYDTYTVYASVNLMLLLHLKSYDKNKKQKSVERSKMDTPSTHMLDRVLSWLGTGTLIKKKWWG